MCGSGVSLKMLSEKFSEKKEDVFTCFLDLEYDRVYDRVQRWKLWGKALKNYGIHELLLKVIKAFYRNGKESVKIKRKERKWIKVGVVLCCASMIVNIFIDNAVMGTDRTGKKWW